jgi:hypothetical protein
MQRLPGSARYFNENNSVDEILSIPQAFRTGSFVKGQKYNQDYFAENVIPALQSERSRFAPRKTLVEFAAQMDPSKCHNGTKVTNTLDNANVIRPSSWSICQR